MAQSGPLLQTLKICLRAERKTYADVAHALGLTESSVKRLFACENFSLERLDVVCRMIGMEISDLVQKMQESAQRLQSLSVVQEKELVEDMALLIVTVCAFNRWSLQQIVGFYHISEAECITKLVRLDQLGLIALLPGNRIRLRIAPNFKWRENGPIQSFFRATIGKEFFDTAFQKEGECLLVLNGMLSAPSSAEFRRKLDRLAREFNDLNDSDAALPLEQRTGMTLVMAMRDWEYGLFQHMMRGQPPKSA